MSQTERAAQDAVIKKEETKKKVRFVVLPVTSPSATVVIKGGQ